MLKTFIINNRRFYIIIIVLLYFILCNAGAPDFNRLMRKSKKKNVAATIDIH